MKKEDGKMIEEQRTLGNFGESELAMRLRDLAIEGHEKNKPIILALTRNFAEHIARKQGFVCVDDMRERLPEEILEKYDKRWFGAIFKDPRFKFVKKTHSRVARNHANIMCLYTLKEK